MTCEFSKHCTTDVPQAVGDTVDSRKVVGLILHIVHLYLTSKELLLFAKGRFGTVGTGNKCKKCQW
jgi:hypothetical protein